MIGDELKNGFRRMDKSAFVLTLISLVFCTFVAFFPGLVFRGVAPVFTCLPFVVGCAPSAIVLWLERVFEIPLFHKST